MEEKERAIVDQLYALHMELFNQQGEEIAALRRANESLQRSHDILAKLMALTGKLIRAN
jgi:hypothetical protein